MSLKNKRHLLQTNLCKWLRGHEGEIFFCTFLGKVELIEVNKFYVRVKKIATDDKRCPDWTFNKQGWYIRGDSKECTLFPSRQQRDWRIWLLEDRRQRMALLKTWKELEDNGEAIPYIVDISEDDPDELDVIKSTKALLKIQQVIEAGYGGYPTEYDWQNSDVFIINYHAPKNTYCVERYPLHHYYKGHIAFRSAALAKEFLHHDENVALVNEYFQVDVTMDWSEEEAAIKRANSFSQDDVYGSRTVVDYR